MATTTDAQPEPLSRREFQIAEAYAGGASYKVIARDLGIAPATVRTHLGTIYRKLGVVTKIALLRALDGAAEAPAVASHDPGRSDRPGGRRQMTLVVASIGEALDSRDPEDAGEIIERFRSAAASEIRRFGGQPLQSSGAEAMGAFGLARAGETDAERATRCAMGLHRVVARETGQDVAIRAVVQTGAVALTGQAATALRPLVHAALELAQTAGAGDVVVCPRTRAALREMIEAVPIGPVANPPRPDAFAVAALSDAPSRFEAQTGYRLSPFVGRSREIGFLETLYQRAAEGEGQVVHVSGEAGIGKSRFARAVLAAADVSDDDLVVFQCQPDAGNSALHAVAAMIRARAGDGATKPLDAAMALFAEAIDDPARDRAALSLLFADGGAQTDGTADVTQSRLLALLDRFLSTQAVPGPLVVLVEDAHWADPTMIDWLSTLGAKIAALPILVIVTARPDLVLPARGAPISTLVLGRLSKEDAARLVSAQFDGRGASDIVDRIATRAEGVPLFIEEIARAHQELGQGIDDVPSSLASLLAGRLDRLGAARQVAQAAAVIGREFDKDLLAELLPQSAKALQMALAKLIETRIIIGRAGMDDSYQFRHALIRDAGYDGLLRAERRALHLALAERLIARQEAGDATPPERIAHHLVAGDAAARSVPYWMKAARAALKTGAGREGAALCRAGRAAAEAIEDARVRDAEICDFLVHQRLGSVYDADIQALIALIDEAEALARRLDDRQRLKFILLSKSYNLCNSGRPSEALALAKDAATIARKALEPKEMIYALGAQGRSNVAMGRFASALPAFVEAGKIGDEVLIDLFLAGNTAASKTWTAFVHNELGQSGAARVDIAVAERAVQGVEGNAHVGLWMNIVAARIDSLAGQHRPVIDRIGPLAEMCETSYTVFFGLLAMSLGPALVESGSSDEGLSLLSRAVDLLEAKRFTFLRPLLYAQYAAALLAVGSAEQALRAAERGVADAEQTGDRAGQGWSLLRRAEARRAMGQPDAAAADLDEAHRIGTALGLAPLIDRIDRYGP